MYPSRVSVRGMGTLGVILMCLSCLCGLVGGCVSGQYLEGIRCLSCPPHTVTDLPGGGSSAHDCRCERGYLCMYYRQVHATVTLNSTLHDFEADHGGVRTAFLSGVARAAGVAREQVRIHFVVIRLNHRRLLASTPESIQVSVVVSGTSVESLDALHRHFNSLNVGGSWEVHRRVLVLAIPAHQMDIQAQVSMEQNA